MTKDDSKAIQAKEDAQKPVRKYDECFDMPFGGNAPEKHISKFFAHIAVGFCWIICKTLWRFRTDKRENLYRLAEKSGVLVVCNHISYLDVVFLYLSVRPEYWPRFIAKNTLFDGKPYILGWILAHVGVFPIHRDTADKTAIKRAVKFLKNKEIVCIMPEGTRRGKSGTDPELHGGAALIARMAKVPILPATVRDADRIKVKGERMRCPKVTIEFGEPVNVSDFDFLPKDERLDGCIWYAMRECFALSKRIPREQVDMKELFPNAKDYTDVFAGRTIGTNAEEDSVGVLSDDSALEEATGA